MSVDGLDATIDHIRRIHTRRVQLTALQTAAEEQLLHRVGCAYRAGEMSDRELFEVYQVYREMSGQGFSMRWDRAIPLSSYRIARAAKVEANNEDGSWHGQGRPAPDEPAPTSGINVVYVLYDTAWRPVYVGSTGNFRHRLGAHTKDKTFEFWRAWPCRDREHAYQREAEMLDEVMPGLNRRREGRRQA